MIRIGLAVMALILALLIPVDAHGPEQWIADKGLTDPNSKQYCCGPSDCTVLPDGDVTEVEGGFQIVTKIFEDTPFSEFIPYSRALPVAPDGRYHLCLNVDRGHDPPVYHARCFIVPPQSG